MKRPKIKPKQPPRNWVAKHAQQFCKAKVEPNKRNAYIRTPKHRHRDFGGSLVVAHAAA